LGLRIELDRIVCFGLGKWSAVSGRERGGRGVGLGLGSGHRRGERYEYCVKGNNRCAVTVHDRRDGVGKTRGMGCRSRSLREPLCRQ
jgi:hypothetical protein